MRKSRDGRLRGLKPPKVGLQISRRIHSQMPAPHSLCRVTAAPWRSVQGAGHTQGEPDPGGASGLCNLMSGNSGSACSRILVFPFDIGFRAAAHWSGNTRTFCVRRLISCCSARSIGLEVRILRRWFSGSENTISPSGTLLSSHLASFGRRAEVVPGVRRRLSEPVGRRGGGRLAAAGAFAKQPPEAAAARRRRPVPCRDHGDRLRGRRPATAFRPRGVLLICFGLAAHYRAAMRKSKARPASDTQQSDQSRTF
jgi:hypothetical protein